MDGVEGRHQEVVLECGEKFTLSTDSNGNSCKVPYARSGLYREEDHKEIIRNGPLQLAKNVSGHTKDKQRAQSQENVGNGRRGSGFTRLYMIKPNKPAVLLDIKGAQKAVKETSDPSVRGCGDYESSKDTKGTQLLKNLAKDAPARPPVRGYYENCKGLSVSDNDVFQFLSLLEEKGIFIYKKSDQRYKDKNRKHNFFSTCETTLGVGCGNGDVCKKLYEKLRNDVRKYSRANHVSGDNVFKPCPYPFMEAGKFLLAATDAKPVFDESAVVVDILSDDEEDCALTPLPKNEAEFEQVRKTLRVKREKSLDYDSELDEKFAQEMLSSTAKRPRQAQARGDPQLEIMYRSMSTASDAFTRIADKFDVHGSPSAPKRQALSPEVEQILSFMNKKLDGLLPIDRMKLLLAVNNTIEAFVVPN